MMSLGGAMRFGEASHPGPRFWLGTVNPSGMAGKERQFAELPAGTWGITETHLSGVNQKARSLNALGDMVRCIDTF